MEYQVKVAAPAEADAYAIYEYLQVQAPAHAERWLGGLFEKIQSLRFLPGRCPLITEAEDLQREIRQVVYGRRSGAHRILFDIQEGAEGGPTVRVLRIWHGARDRIQREDLQASE